MALPRAALAEQPEPAEESFQRGRALLAEGRYAEACKNFEESHRRDPASGTLLALAYCQELAGLLASALTNYRAAAELAQREGQAERRAAAAERSTVMAERVSRLTIDVPSTLATIDGLRITLNGTAVEKAQFGAPIPVDGGNHTIEVTVSGRPAWSATVTVLSERDRKTLVVETMAQAAELVAAPAPTPNRGRTQPEKAPDDAARRSLEYASVGFAGGALVSLGLGIGFGISAYSKNRASLENGHCDASGCDAQGFELRNDALAAASVSTWSMVVSGVCGFTSAALYFASKSAAKAPRAGLKAHVSAGSAGLAVAGEF